jgi:FixJ family two-component response regulator
LTPAPTLELALEMMDGGWIVVSEDVDGGERRYLARRPAAGTARALSTREREVLIRALRGESNKYIALSLGVLPSSVSNWLKRARVKLAGRVPEALLANLVGSLPVRVT